MNKVVTTTTTALTAIGVRENIVFRPLLSIMLANKHRMHGVLVMCGKPARMIIDLSRTYGQREDRLLWGSAVLHTYPVGFTAGGLIRIVSILAVAQKE